MGRTIFVTGTNTGAGKTIVTSLLLARARAAGLRARALKPFSSGDRTDALLLWHLQDEEIPLDTVNPFHFAAPVSPWTAARLENRSITKAGALEQISRSCAGADLCLMEGAGGLLSPLAEDLDARAVIRELGAEVLVVAPNHLGVLNQVLLTLEALKNCLNAPAISVALAEHGGSDASHRTNLDDLVLLTGLEVVTIPFIEDCRPEPEVIRQAAVSMAPALDRLMQKKSPGHGCRGDSFP